jgi:hypothetical protein
VPFTLLPRLLLTVCACFCNPLASQAQPGADKPPVFSLEFSMELPHATSNAVWSADGRILAAVPTVHPALQLIYVDTQEHREWSTPFPFQLLSTAISPDNRLVAVHQPAKGNRLWLYSIADRTEIARAELPLGGCRLGTDLTAGGGLAFSIDGSALWLGCNVRRQVTGTYPAAVRLSLRDLQEQDRVDLAPIADSPLSVLHSSTFSVHNGRLLWTQIVGIYATDSQRPRLSQQFVRVIDLDTEQELFPPMRIRTDSGYRFPSLLQYAMVLPEHGMAVVFRRLTMREPPPPVGTPDFAFETYDIRSGTLLAEFWSGKEQQDTDTGGQVLHAVLIPGSAYLVGAIDASFNPRKHGGLILWDVRTGTIVQRVPGPSAQHVRVSHDGRRVALFAHRTLLMYRGER